MRGIPVLLASVAAGMGSLWAQETSLLLYPERIELTDGSSVVADRGMLHVPLKRSDPESRAIGVEFYRFHALETADAGVPPVFLLHGGPGWPGMSQDLANRGYYEERILPYVEVSDLVVVGQRGIGSSPPNTECGGYEPPPVDVAPSEEEEAELMREACARCRAFWESQGYDLTGFNVLEAAADVNDVRQALGYDKITLWGVSFGSHWSMATMRAYPEIVERAVLGGMEGPDHTYDMPGWVLNALERIAEAAESAPELEGHIPEGGLIAGFKEAIARVEAEPAEVTVRDARTRRSKTVLITADRMRSAALGVTGRVSSRRGVPTWPRDLIALHRGDYDAAAQALLRQNDGDLPTASFFMLDCGSGISPARLAELQADPGAKVVGKLGGFYQSTCPSWGSDLGDDFRRNFDTGIPTVIVQGNWDTSTPFENALELAPHFKKSTFVVVHGGSHGALREALEEDDLFAESLWEFVRSGDMGGIPEEIELPPIEWVVPEEDA